MLIYINKNRLIESISYDSENYGDKIEQMLDDMFASKSFLEFESTYPKSYNIFKNNYANEVLVDDEMTFEDVVYEVLVTIAMDDDEDQDDDEDYGYDYDD